MLGINTLTPTDFLKDIFNIFVFLRYDENIRFVNRKLFNILKLFH